MSNRAREPFVSKLKRGPERFLAHVIEHGLDGGRRSYEDFIRHFPPAAIMEGLRDRPDLRSGVLVITTGIKSKIAEKKTWENAGQDLQIALEEDETDAETIVMLFAADDRVQFLDARQLWSYITEGDFWKASSGLDLEVAKAHIAFMLERALIDELITHRDIVDGVSVNELTARLPRRELAALLTRALTCGRDGKGFVDANVLDAVPIATLVEHIPLPHIWSSVIEPRIAQAHGYAVRKTDSVRPAAPHVAPNAAGPASRPRVNGDNDSSALSAEQAATPLPRAGSRRAPPPPPVEAKEAPGLAGTDPGTESGIERSA